MAPSQPERGWSSWANQPSSLQFPISTLNVCKSEKPYTCLEIVASGINEYKPIDRNYSEEEIEKTNKLLQFFNLELIYVIFFI